MLTPRENVMAVWNGEQPDSYGDFMVALNLVPDPIWVADRCPQDGQIHKDTWGVEYCWIEDSPARHPVERPEGLVIKDIESWQDQLKLPDISNLDWSAAKEAAAAVDKKEQFCAIFSSAGLFERSHHLMGFEEGLVNYMLYPEEVSGILRAIADWKIAYHNMAADELGIDALFYQDDWGSKRSLFLPPDLWRTMIKPLHTEIVAAAKAKGIFFVHHADCYCQPIVEDMVEMGIDLWQGAIPQNDIVEIQRITKGKLAMQGGIDGPAIDSESTTEEEVRAEVRRCIDTYCPGGRFFPGSAYGPLFTQKNQAWLVDEMNTYGKQWALDHPTR